MKYRYIVIDIIYRNYINIRCKLEYQKDLKIIRITKISYNLNVKINRRSRDKKKCIFQYFQKSWNWFEYHIIMSTNQIILNIYIYI